MYMYHAGNAMFLNILLLSVSTVNFVFISILPLPKLCKKIVRLNDLKLGKDE